MTVEHTYVEHGDFLKPYLPLGPSLGTTSLDMTMVNANGYSGNIVLTPDSTTYSSYDVDTESERYYMGTLWLGGITNPSGTQDVNIIVDGSNTDVGFFECIPTSGSAPTVVAFEGTNDSISMYPGSVTQAVGDTMDLSHTYFCQLDATTGATSALAKLVVHGSGGNDTFTGAALNNFLYEGSGNCTFHQSAGNDVITCNGGNSTYYANDSWTNYQGGYQDQNGTSYLNNGEDWELKDTVTGQMVFLTNVSTVVLDGVTYSSTAENQAASAWSNTTSAATSSGTSALSASLQTDSAFVGANASVMSTAMQDIHSSVLADFSLKTLQSSALVGGSTASSARYDEYTISSSAAASVLSGVSEHSVITALPTTDSSSILVA